jgi:hypothetical protein
VIGEVTALAIGFPQYLVNTQGLVASAHSLPHPPFLRLLYSKKAFDAWLLKGEVCSIRPLRRITPLSRVQERSSDLERKAPARSPMDASRKKIQK